MPATAQECLHTELSPIAGLIMIWDGNQTCHASTNPKSANIDASGCHASAQQGELVRKCVSSAAQTSCCATAARAEDPAPRRSHSTRLFPEHVDGDCAKGSVDGTPSGLGQAGVDEELHACDVRPFSARGTCGLARLVAWVGEIHRMASAREGCGALAVCGEME